MNEKFDLQGFAVNVLHYLPGWTFIQPPNDGDRWRDEVWAKANGPDGTQLHFHYDTCKKRVRVDGEYPREKGSTYNLYPARDKRPEAITVAVDRDPAAIAKDILRRYIPAYLEAHKLGVEQLAKHDEYEQGCDALVKRFGQLCNEQPRGHSIHYYKSDHESGYFDLTVDGLASVRMDLRSLPAAKAEAIIKILLSK